MDPIYSSISSHHTVSQIDKTMGICDFSLIIIPLIFIGCWVASILYNTILGKTKKYPMKLLVNLLTIGLIVAIAGFFYLYHIYSC